MSLSLKSLEAEKQLMILISFILILMFAVLDKIAPYDHIMIGGTLLFTVTIFFGVDLLVKIKKEYVWKTIFATISLIWIAGMFYISGLKRDYVSNLVNEKGVSKQIEVKVYEGESYIKNANGKYVFVNQL